MSEFKREDRYVVFKISDTRKYLSPSQDAQLRHLYAEVLGGRILDGKQGLNCVVVEKDWPEYDMVWESIEKRMMPERRFRSEVRRGLNLLGVEPPGYKLTDCGLVVGFPKKGIDQPTSITLYGLGWCFNDIVGWHYPDDPFGEGPLQTLFPVG